MVYFSAFLGWVQKDTSATDYSDISELAEEEDKKIFYQHGLSFVSNIDKDKKSGWLQIGT